MTADFIIYADEDWPQQFQYVDSQAAGIDISDAVSILFVATTGGALATPTCTSPNCIKKSLGAGIEFTDDGTDGGFTVTIDGTSGMGGTTFGYEIKLTDVNTLERVIYPAPGVTATFNVLESLTDGVTP